MNLSLVGAVMSLTLWLLLGFVAPLGAGWVHLLLAVGLMLLVRRVVAGRHTW